MKTKTKTKKPAPRIGCRPADMKPLEQILCMIWLATNHTLEELRKRQTLIELQFKKARELNCSDRTFKELMMMQSNTDAAVAYQSWPKRSVWQAFIQTD